MPTITSYFGFLPGSFNYNLSSIYWSKQNTTYLKLTE